MNSWLCCGYSVVKNKNLVLLISETARWTTTLRSRRKPGWSRTQTRTLLVSLLIKGGDVRICFITGRECPSVYHFRVRADNSLPEYLIVNNKQMAEPSTATQQNNISTNESRVIMNKLHGFLRQRSVLASGSPPPTMSIAVNGEESNANCSATFITAGILLGCLQRVRHPG